MFLHYPKAAATILMWVKPKGPAGEATGAGGLLESVPRFTRSNDLGFLLINDDSRLNILGPFKSTASGGT